MLDVIIVAFLIYQMYRLLRGTIAFNIFIGVFTLYVIYIFVNKMEMNLLSMVLDKFVSWGVLLLIIIFQPEVRKFLLVLGNNTLKGRLEQVQRIFGFETSKSMEYDAELIEDVVSTIRYLASQRLGAILVVEGVSELDSFVETGVKIDGRFSASLLESIFTKKSPLHDGAVIMRGPKVRAAKCILPVSDNKKMFRDLGLRHRAGVGITESHDATAIIVSEESGHISVAYNGKLTRVENDKFLKDLLRKPL